MASRENLTLIGLLHPRRPGYHGATMCTLQVQEQDPDYDRENAERENRNRRSRSRIRSRGRSRSRSRAASVLNVRGYAVNVSVHRSGGRQA